MAARIQPRSATALCRSQSCVPRSGSLSSAAACAGVQCWRRNARTSARNAAASGLSRKSISSLPVHQVGERLVLARGIVEREHPALGTAEVELDVVLHAETVAAVV